MGILSILFDNPLIIAGGLGLVTILVYLSSENMYMKHKTRELKRSIMRGWGLFLILLAVLSLFTTSWHLILENVDMVSSPTGYVTLEKANELCGTGSFERCDIISYGYLGSLAAIGLGVLLIVIGSFRIRQRVERAKREEKRKKSK